jgi:hypothetical protein
MKEPINVKICMFYQLLDKVESWSSNIERPSKPKRNIRNWGREMQCLSYTWRLAYSNILLFGELRGPKHNSEDRIARNMVLDPINVKSCMIIHKNQSTSRWGKKLKFEGFIKEGAIKGKSLTSGRFYRGVQNGGWKMQCSSIYWYQLVRRETYIVYKEALKL